MTFFATLLCGLVLHSAARAEVRRAHCTAAIARPTTVEAIQAAIETWEGHCVRVQGLGTTRRLYANRQALLDPLPYDETPTARSIVINPFRRLPRPHPPRQAEVVGTVGRCVTEYAIVNGMRAREPDAIIMLAGYCHTSLENYLRPVAIRFLSERPIPRLTEAEVPPERRELVDVPENLPGRASGLAAARAMLTAIQLRDEAAFARLDDPASAAERARPGAPTPASWLRENLRETHRRFRQAIARNSVFAGLPASATRQERNLIARGDRDYALANPASGAPGFITCWCRTPDCSGRWPVRALDADNDPSRPYACIRTNEYMLGPGRGVAIQALARIEPDGFTER